MKTVSTWALCTVLALSPVSLLAQRPGEGFNNGLHQSVQRNGYNDRYDRGRYQDRDRSQGGIGPGKGALIGGAGGAALGALFGGGLKGAIIGGGVGAGGGAILGKVNQNNQRSDYRDGRYRR